MQKAQEAAAVGVTNLTRYLFVICPVFCLLMYSQVSSAAVLPEDRTDILLHNYSGDNSTFKGPSILVRKEFKETYSAWANYYVDMNSAASIDVETQGSKYTEERTEMSAGIDYLYDSTILSASFTNSSENDYEADSFALGLSQDFFGDMSTLTMGYSQGSDDIYQNERAKKTETPPSNKITSRTYAGSAEHRRFSIGWSQVFTKNWIVAFNTEASVDEGFLRNPYRAVRYSAPTDSGFLRVPENYPLTRSSQAFAVKSMYYLPWHAALKLELRTFKDSWDIKASNYEIKYIQPYKEHWTFEFRYRGYQQTQADFYSDLFDAARSQDNSFKASDKELSTFQNSTIGLGITYELNKRWIWGLDKVTINLFSDLVSSTYENFGDKRLSEGIHSEGLRAGEEPMFSFDAHITRLFISIWY